MSGEQLKEMFSKASFEALLDAAEDNCKTVWEEEFCEDIRYKFSKFGTAMYISEAQIRLLERLCDQ